MSPIEFHALTARVRCEFMEMPGLRLTLGQASRLWGIEQSVCGQIIEVLVRTDFLRWTPAGTVGRADG